MTTIDNQFFLSLGILIALKITFGIKKGCFIQKGISQVPMELKGYQVEEKLKKAE